MAQVNYNRWLGRQNVGHSSVSCRPYGNSYNICDIYVGNVYRSDPSSNVTVRGITGFLGAVNEGWKGASQNRSFQGFCLAASTNAWDWGSGLSGYGPNIAGVRHCGREITLCQSGLNNVNFGVSGSQSTVRLYLNSFWTARLNNGATYFDKNGYESVSWVINIPKATAPSKLSSSAQPDMDKVVLNLTVGNRGAFSTITRVMYRIDGGSWIIYRDNISPNTTFAGEGKTIPLTVGFEVPRTFEFDTEHTYEFQVLNSNGLTANISGKWKQPRGITYYRQQTVKGSLNENFILNPSFETLDSNGDNINYWSSGTIINSDSNVGNHCLSLTASQASSGITYDFGEKMPRLAINFYVKGIDSTLTVTSDNGYVAKVFKYNSADWERCIAFVPSTKTITIKASKAVLLDDISATSTTNVGNNYISFKEKIAKLDHLDPKARFKYYSEVDYPNSTYKQLISSKSILNLAQEFVLKPVPQSVLSTLQHGQVIINQGANMKGFISIENGKYYLVIRNYWQVPQSDLVTYTNTTHRNSISKIDLSEFAIINFIPYEYKGNDKQYYQLIQWAAVQFGNLAPYFYAKQINKVPTVDDYLNPGTSGILLDAISNTEAKTHQTGINYWRDLAANVNRLLYSNTDGTTTRSDKWKADSLRFDNDMWINLGRHDWSNFTVEICYSNINDTNTFTGAQEHIALANFQNGGFGLNAHGSDHTPSLSYAATQPNGQQYYSRLRTGGNFSNANTTQTFSARYSNGGNIYLLHNLYQAFFPKNTNTIRMPQNNTVLAVGCNPNGSQAAPICFVGNIKCVRCYNYPVASVNINKNQAIDICRYDSTAFNKISLPPVPSKVIPTNLASESTDTHVTLTWDSTGAHLYQINVFNGERWCFYNSSTNSITIPLSDFTNVKNTTLKVASVYQTPSNKYDLSEFSDSLYLGDPPEFELESGDYEFGIKITKPVPVDSIKVEYRLRGSTTWKTATVVGDEGKVRCVSGYAEVRCRVVVKNATSSYSTTKNVKVYSNQMGYNYDIVGGNVEGMN